MARVTPSRAALGVAVAVAVAFGLSFPAVVMPDSALYSEPARSWARGEGLLESAGRPLESRLPAFPFVLGLIFRVFGESLTAITLVNVAFHVGAMLLAREWLRPRDPAAADGMAAIAIVYPPFLTAAATVLQESMLAFLIALFAWTLWRAAETGGRGWSGAAGIALGLAALGKVVVLPLAAPAAALLAFVPRRSAFRPAAFLFGASAVVLPWALRNAQAIGRFEFTNNNGGHGMLGGTVSNTIEDWHAFPEYRAAVERWEREGRRGQPVLDRYLYGVALERIAAEPARWAGLVAGRTVRFMLPSRHWMAAAGLTTTGTLSPLFVAGAVFQGLVFLATALLALQVLRGHQPITLLIGPGIVFGHLLAYAPTYVSPRYNIPVGPLLASSAALWWCRARARSGRSLLAAQGDRRIDA